MKTISIESMSESMNELDDKWNFPNAIEVCVPPGWVGLVDRLMTRLTATGFDADQVDQIKEKLGGLRFYASGRIGDNWPAYPTKEQGDLIAEAEAESLRTCRLCGAPGRPCTKGGWVLTLCGEHGYSETPHGKTKVAKNQSKGQLQGDE